MNQPIVTALWNHRRTWPQVEENLILLSQQALVFALGIAGFFCQLRYSHWVITLLLFNVGVSEGLNS